MLGGWLGEQGADQARLRGATSLLADGTHEEDKLSGPAQRGSVLTLKPFVHSLQTTQAAHDLAHTRTRPLSPRHFSRSPPHPLPDLAPPRLP